MHSAHAVWGMYIRSTAIIISIPLYDRMHNIPYYANFMISSRHRDDSVLQFMSFIQECSVSGKPPTVCIDITSDAMQCTRSHNGPKETHVLPLPESFSVLSL